jgi:hypothetical protein
MKPNEDPTTSEILHRLVVPIQTRGNLGKSTEAIARCEWMSQRGVLWKGYDLDAFNRTLSTTYPENVVFVEPGAEPEGELIKIFRRLAHSEVTVIDPSAHMNRTILRAMEMVRLTELCGAIAARVTVLIYPVDEVSDIDDLAQTVENLENSVDWVIVRNPVKIPTTKFPASISRTSGERGSRGGSALLEGGHFPPADARDARRGGFDSNAPCLSFQRHSRRDVPELSGHHGRLFRLWLVEALASLRPDEGRRTGANAVGQQKERRSFHPIDKIECPYPRGANDRQSQARHSRQVCPSHGTC